MADQVNPVGSLAPGMAQIVQALAANPPPQSSQVQSGEPTPSLKPQAKPEADAPRESLEAAVKNVEDYLQQSPTNLRFGVDKETGMFYFRVVNPETQVVIRQVPSEEILAMSRRLRQLTDSGDSSGILMDEEG